MKNKSRISENVAKGYEILTESIDRTIGWHSLPAPIGLAVLLGLRGTLRRKNLVDTTMLPSTEADNFDNKTSPITTRSSDGSCNDLSKPSMGMAETRFGRNIPLEQARRESAEQILTPNPREVSRKLLTRTELIPAESVNALTASWLQFMVQDWFNHENDSFNNRWEIPLEKDDTWPTGNLRIPRLKPDNTREKSYEDPPTFINTETHWWDASQIYGNDLEQQQLLRVGHDGMVETSLESLNSPMNRGAKVLPTSIPGFWYGMFMLHTLFRSEHNAICHRLKSEYPHCRYEELFQRARLINAALIAKIHTVEWTLAVISYPTTKLALRVNWWGIAGERIYRQFGRISRSSVISGIPGSKVNHYGVPYSITEEFAAVYRMHPLMPDIFNFREAKSNKLLESLTLQSLAGKNVIPVAERISMTDAFYTLGTMHPGLVTLHNFPHFLQNFERPDGKMVDLAATDILRIREQGVPRYNDFRRLLHVAPAKSFEELTENADDAKLLADVYAGDIEKVDLMVGMYAEKRPNGFAFSDTAFRIFIVMASRRLNSDRFFTDYYRPEVYTEAGMSWIQDNTMATVLRRHFPELNSAIRDVTHNAFLPWRVASADESD